jgi:DNA-binding response OmpR family regulator
VGKINELAVEGAAENPPRNFHVPKTRKYPCCIRIERERAKENGQAKLALFIKGQQVDASQTQTALLACLHENQGHIVSYKQLARLLGHRSTRPEQLHILRQYASWITKTLAAHKALCMLAVAPRVGYVLCGHK